MRTDVKILLTLVAVAALAFSCKRHHDATSTMVSDAGKASVAAAPSTPSTVAIDTSGFKANIEIPGIEFDGSKMDIDGVKLPTGSAIKGMRVNATDKDGQERGSVVFDFASPLAPVAVADHLTAQMKDSDWTGVTRTTAADGAIVLAATKADDGTDHIEYRLTADGTSATRGTATIVGNKGSSKKTW
jgi:hypothetical protein